MKLLLDKTVKNSFVGIFSRECVQLNYFFVTDTIGLREKFVVMFREQFPNRTLGLNMIKDKEWDTYLNFLYPGENYDLLNDTTTLHDK